MEFLTKPFILDKITIIISLFPQFTEKNEIPQDIDKVLIMSEKLVLLIFLSYKWN